MKEANERCWQSAMGGESVGATRGDQGARRRAASRSDEALWSAPAVAALPATEADGVVSRLPLEAVMPWGPLRRCRLRPATALVTAYA